MHDVETRYAAGNDGHVAYQVIGNGSRDLVFVPNWGNNVDVMWEEPSLARFLRRLATFSRLLCFDKRGTGVSDPVTLDTLPTLEQWMEDVRSVMNAVGSVRTAIFGDSEGGQMAMLFAATSSRPSTARRGRYAARPPSGTRSARWGSRFERGCTPANAS